MEQRQTPSYDKQLAQDIVALCPELAGHYQPEGPDGATREEVGIYITALFGKIWHVRALNFEEAGRQREVQIGALQRLDLFDTAAIDAAVSGLFPDTFNPNRG